ncbi:branched-chain amino acid transport system ATP-binding protein [Rhizobium sp. BK313]|uniref:ATP-binding cassette domain-containing protein n=1 Tax=Rhizobium sp. BK313 TaxID=2587081 RepID=UPI00106146DC|nr:ATP-binding cassette domain-containing protein [Rhizobium sp. BK313]MBB3459302.1 branched-chain amino acid transport system ATP-binding protein [Rhizobium sp. BK313]
MSTDVALLEVQNLSAGYGNKTVLHDVSFKVKPGQILALLGHNGCGKTTTLKNIIGMGERATGDMYLSGERIDKLKVSERISRGLRLLPEGRGIFATLTIGENLDVVADRNCRGPDNRFEVKDVLELFPALSGRLDTIAGSLSGGQQQMLALGLALLGSPRCILLDEPSIGLAPNLVERLFELVRDVCRSSQLGAVLVEQNVAASMKIADHVTILNNGAVVFDGSPEEARNSNFWHYF